jgi:hypothetical protein
LSTKIFKKDLNPKCSFFGPCRTVAQQLLDLGIPKSGIGMCGGSTAWPCRFLIDNVKMLFGAVDPSSAESIDELVTVLLENDSDLVFDPAVDQVPERPFRCPELPGNIDIYVPCKISSCRFHTNNPWTHNCMLIYMDKNCIIRTNKDTYKRRPMTNHELAFLLGIPTNEIRSRLLSALSKLRQGALHETMAKDRSEALTPLSIENVCIVCEIQIEEELYVEKEGYSWCSEDCWNLKPYVAVNLEQRFTMPIRQILQTCIQKFGTPPLMANALGISTPMFEGLCKTNDLSL